MANGTLKSWNLACPKCGAREAITLDLNELAALTCSACDESFSAAAAVSLAREHFQRWQAVASWIASAGEILAATTTE